MSRATLPPEPALAASLGGEAQAGRRAGFAAVYVLTAVVTAAAVAVTAFGPGTRPLETTSRLAVVALAINLVLILGLAFVGARRVRALFATHLPDAGARLHRRFVGLFALAAVVPAVIVALFFGLLVTRGVDSWFSRRVSSAVEATADIAKAYVADQINAIQRRLPNVSADLNRNAPLFAQSRLQFAQLMLTELATYDFSAVYMIDADGRVLARAEQSGAPAYLAPPPDMLRTRGADAPLRLDASDMARAVFRLSAYPDAYLYVVRPLGEGAMAKLRRAENSVLAYHEAERARGRVQQVFVLSYVSVALLVLIGAVWVGLAVANQIATPVARLVQAADL
ncbi:MAG: PAS domain-containing sensor histidine kinase, partial [Caulobacteraceae bacterium]|nr:PAS domain-containing sensor histidine kinase [Caulobacter sp.]